ncbi:hypothetical protein FUAX_20730 [Fulvitalea axinellae]|uniref:FAS1 domain-containing protein n=1 Tax=Fulvitalea axinellae TaxID=1182444 RepID=A0AAU9D9R7_9BACT|nr:hypothetical protein FUAX_20730 [Fulvitalea axinellae]
MNRMAKKIRAFRVACLGLMLALFIFTGCDNDNGGAVFEDTKLRTVTEYFENEGNGEFSEWTKLLRASKYYGLLAARGNYTFLACKNDAMEAFYSELGVSGVDGLEKDYVDLLVRTHTVMTGFESFSFRQGPMSDTTMNGNKLVVAFGSEGLNGLKVNQKSTILERDIECSNGFLHILDRPVEPISKGVHGTLKDLGKYGILTEAIEKTGLIDTLELETTEKGTRVLYTVLAEPDEVYKAKGIEDFAGLVEKLGAGNDYTSRDNKLNRFVRNHVISGKLFSDRFKTDILLTVGSSMVKMIKNSDGYFINTQIDDFGNEVFEGANTLDVYNLDMQSKNATIHDVKDVLFEAEFDPILVEDDIIAVPELYGFQVASNDQEVVYVDKVERWRAKGYTQFVYMYRNNSSDHLNCYVAESGWFEYTTRPILKGTYDISFRSGSGNFRATMSAWIDGQRSENLVYPPAWNVPIGRYTFTENGRHKFMLKSVAGGRLSLDRLVFKPVK